MHATITAFLNLLAALAHLAGAFLTFRTSVLWLTVELSRFRGQVNTEVFNLPSTPWESHASPR